MLSESRNTTAWQILRLLMEKSLPKHGEQPTTNNGHPAWEMGGEKLFDVKAMEIERS